MPELHVPAVSESDLEDDAALSRALEIEIESEGASESEGEEDFPSVESPSEDAEDLAFSFSDGVPEEPEFKPRRKRGRPRKTYEDHKDDKRAAKIDHEYGEFLSGFDFADGQHKITVYREEPAHDLETGHRISGLLQTFTHPISGGEIQKRFGGGVYRIIVRGPRSSGKGSVIKSNKTFQISGHPLPLPDPSSRKRESEGAVDLMRSALESRDAEISDMRKEVKESNNLALQAILQKPDDNPMMSQFMVQMREDQRRQEEQRREERGERQVQMEAQERRHNDEKEAAERRWREEGLIEARRHDQAREEARMRHERDMAQFEQQIKSQSQAQENMFSMMVKLQGDQEKKTADVSSQNLSLVQEFQSAQMNQMQNNYEMMFEMSQSQVKEAREAKRQNDDFSSTVGKLSQLREAASLFDSSASDDRPGWERIMDKIGDAIPGMMSAASSLGEAGQGQAQLVAPRPQIAPGSVAIVPPQNVQQKIKVSSVESPPPATKAEVVGEGLPEAGAESAEDPRNNLSDYIPFGESIEGEQAIQILIRNIDFGITQNHTDDAIFDKSVSGLQDAFKSSIKELGVEGLLTFIEDNVPHTWAISSLQGEEVVRRLYGRLAA